MGKREDDAHSVSFHSLGTKKNNALQWKEFSLPKKDGTKRMRRAGGKKSLEEGSWHMK
jgi:hypothetical protein